MKNHIDLALDQDIDILDDAFEQELIEVNVGDNAAWSWLLALSHDGNELLDEDCEG